MAVATAVADLGSELVEVAPLDGLQAVGNAVQRCVLWRIVPDACGSALGVAEITLEASPIPLAASESSGNW